MFVAVSKKIEQHAFDNLTFAARFYDHGLFVSKNRTVL
jgi:hypothetical protein